MLNNQEMPIEIYKLLIRIYGNMFSLDELKKGISIIGYNPTLSLEEYLNEIENELLRYQLDLYKNAYVSEEKEIILEKIKHILKLKFKRCYPEEEENRVEEAIESLFASYNEEINLENLLGRYLNKKSAN